MPDDLTLKPAFVLNMPRYVDVSVYIWRTKAELNAAANWIVKRRKKMIGAYVAYRTSDGWTREIHLMQKYIGAGYVSHELTHLAVHAFELLGEGALSEMNEEAFADFMEEATRQFWDKYYELSDA